MELVLEIDPLSFQGSKLMTYMNRQQGGYPPPDAGGGPGGTAFNQHLRQPQQPQPAMYAGGNMMGQQPFVDPQISSGLKKMGLTSPGSIPEFVPSSAANNGSGRGYAASPSMARHRSSNRYGRGRCHSVQKHCDT